jgi:hypothetical protein
MLTKSVDILNTYTLSTSQNKKKLVEATSVIDFDISAICWHEVYPKMQLLKIRNFLNNSLRISNYSSEVKSYFLLFIVELPQNTIHEKKWKKGFYKKDTVIENNLHLDYHKFEKATETEALTMQAEAYLEGILQIPTLRGMKKVKFDSQKFYDDCKNLFENAGWIKKEL